MTLISPPFGLPFQEAGDRLCDAPAVWCEFAQNVDAAIQAMDLVLGRMEPAVPAVSVRQLTELFIPSTGTHSIPFEAVDFDTDGMFNPSLSTTRVFPRRTGWYHVEGWARCQEVANEFGSTIEFFLTQGAFGTGPDGSGFLGNFAEEDNAGAFSIEFYVRASATLPFIATVGDAIGFTPLPFLVPQLDQTGFGLGFNIGAPGGLFVRESRFSMHWLRDL